MEHMAGRNLISIRTSGGGRTCYTKETREHFYDFIDMNKETFASMLVLKFDDCWDGSQGVVPTVEDVKKALEWSEGKDNIVVHCSAGITRSSAIAYVIYCKKLGVADAIENIDFRKHAPNHLIVKIGADILGDPLIESEFEKVNDLHKKYIGGVYIG